MSLKKRLIKAQVRTSTPITPEQQQAAHQLIDKLSKGIEDNYQLAIKNKIKFEDLFNYQIEQSLEQNTGISDIRQIINLPELVRLLQLELERRQYVYNIVKPYLTKAYDQWADRPY